MNHKLLRMIEEAGFQFTPDVMAKLPEFEKLVELENKWIGLTDEEHIQIAIDCGCLGADWVFYGAAVERKLKEKNAPNL